MTCMGGGYLCLREPVKLEVTPKKKKLATELGFDKSLTWALKELFP